ncbi:MAG TPA: hypothetical protein VFZ34_21070, partial [Blastocatellia bacterium]|nr:hypothetical protein [Blastocatellia bacterium]
MSNGKKHKRQQVTKAPVKGKQKNTLQREPLVVALQLRFIDCEAIIRPFPKNFEVEVVFGNNARTEIRKIDNDEGKLIFPLLRDDANRFKFLRLHFNSGTNNYILCEKRGDPKTQIVCDKAKADEKSKDGQRFFRLPSKWSLLTSEWAVVAKENVYNNAAKEKNFLLTEKGKPRSIGTREEPVEMLLNPHWQYLKFEFFDRYYGHSDHNNKPISIPSVTVEGFYKAKAGDAKPDVRSNWTMVQDNDEKKALQCLPWILQAKEDGTAEPKPDKDSSLQFQQPKDSFIFSKSATERVIKPMTRPLTNAEDVANFKPCANRLKYYDLPETWKSQKYWCRLSDGKAEQGFFEKMADKKTMMQKPLIFSLDDIVLTDKDINPLSLCDTDRVVVFYHEFLDAASDPNKRGDG